MSIPVKLLCRLEFHVIVKSEALAGPPGDGSGLVFSVHLHTVRNWSGVS